MFGFILAVHIIVAIAMIGLILIQHGKGADAGASFGAGAAGTVFGAAGTANFLTRATAILAGLFFVTSLALAAHARKEAADQLRLDIPAQHTSAPAPTLSIPQSADSMPAPLAPIALESSPAAPLSLALFNDPPVSPSPEQTDSADSKASSTSP